MSDGGTSSSEGIARNSREKLLYIMNHYSADGATHFGHVIGLLEEMANQGTEIRLLIERADSVPKIRSPNIQLLCLPSDLAGLSRWAALRRAISEGLSDGYRAVFIRISAWSALAAILSARGNRGLVFFWQSGTTIEFDRAQPWGRDKIRWWLRSRLPATAVWRLVDVFVTGPEAMIDYYADVGNVPRQKLRLLYNDVDHRRFDWSAKQRKLLRRQLRGRLALPDDAVLLLFVHRLSPVRRTLDYLPHALLVARENSALDNVCLLVVGDGGDLPELRRRCEVADLLENVRFLGEWPNAGIEDLYAASDIFLQPSHAEGFPRVLVEAMVAGLPIVTTDAGGSGELLGEAQQMYVVPKDEPHSYAERLVALLLDRDVWSALAEENRREAKAYDTPAVARMYREVLFGG